MHTENTSTSSRSFLSPEQLAPRASQQAAAFHADVINAVRQEVQARPVVVVGMAQNPWVKKARKALTDAGIQFTYLEYGSYLSKWKERLAIKLWSGWPTFPQVYVRGVLIGGHEDTRAAIADGSLRSAIAAK
jgi:glutaredoxin-related protein